MFLNMHRLILLTVNVSWVNITNIFEKKKFTIIDLLSFIIF